MGEAELATFGELMRPSVDACNAVDRMTQELPPAGPKPGKLSAVRGAVVPIGQ
jgi:hypothetical protein